MAQEPIGSVSGPTSVSDAKALPGEPGALEGFDDGTYRFTGDGIVTLPQIAERVLAAETGRPQGADLAPLVAQNPFEMAQATARLIQSQNPELLGQPLDKPIGKNQVVDIEWATVKSALTGLAKNIDKLKEFVAAGSPDSAGGMDRATSRTLGNARTPARGLPID